MLYRRLSVVALILLALLLSACQSTLKKDIEEYETSMQEIYKLGDSYKEALDTIDFEKAETLHVGTDTKIPREDIDEITDTINEKLIPISEEMNEKVDKIEVTNEDIEKVHEDYEESLELKEEFAKELGHSIELYLDYDDSTNQLVKDGEVVASNKEKRDHLIQSDHTKKEKKEINHIVDVINENSKELEEEVNILQDDTKTSDKQNKIESSILPLLDRQIENINQLTLETEQAKEVRAISLEMFYTFKSYYKERVNLMQINEEAQDVQLKNIISLVDTFDKIDENYHTDLDKLKTREK